MPGKVTVKVNKNNKVSVVSELEGDGLLKAYEALTYHIAMRLKNPDDIVFISNKNALDALEKVNSVLN